MFAHPFFITYTGSTQLADITYGGAAIAADGTLVLGDYSGQYLLSGDDLIPHHMLHIGRPTWPATVLYIHHVIRLCTTQYHKDSNPTAHQIVCNAFRFVLCFRESNVKSAVRLNAVCAATTNNTDDAAPLH